MTPDEHSALAVRLLDEASRVSVLHLRAVLVATAQVHATLALRQEVAPAKQPRKFRAGYNGYNC